MDAIELLIKQLKSLKSYKPSGAKGLHAYASEAGDCARKVGLRLLSAPADSNAWTDASTVNTSVGNFLHDNQQDAIANYIRRSVPRLFGMTEQQRVDFEIPWVGDRISGRADGLYVHPDLWDQASLPTSNERVVLEIKSQNPRAFSSIVAYGPNQSHVLQGSISALHLDADFVHMVYINKLPSPGEDPGKEFLLPVDHLSAQAAEERLQQVVDLAADQTIPEREWQGYILDPEGQFPKWPCGYCPFVRLCSRLGSGAQPFENISAISEVA